MDQGPDRTHRLPVIMTGGLADILPSRHHNDTSPQYIEDERHMAKALDYSRLPHLRNTLIPVNDWTPRKKKKEHWSSAKGGKVRHFSQDEIDRWTKSHPDRLR